jgi:hypothetical protein
MVRSCCEFTVISSPRWRALAAACSICRFVVFPQTAGP